MVKALKTKGFSLVEMVIAIGVFALLSAAIISLLLGGLELGDRNSQVIKANSLVSEAFEAARYIAGTTWVGLRYHSSGLNESDGHWTLAGEGTSDTIGEFTRTLVFTDVYRDAGGELTNPADSGAVLDPNSRMLEVSVTWPGGKGSDLDVTRSILLSKWRGNE